MSMINDFKAFIARGNVLDLAIGVIMGAAFGKVVSTFTEGIIMPIVGMAMGGVDFTQKFINLSDKALPMKDGLVDLEAVAKSGLPVLRYGQLISDIVTFVIVGFVMFMIAKAAMGYFTRLAAETPPPPPTPEETLLSEIRDLLAKK
jgi:large conductance mechanosensitive channel